MRHLLLCLLFAPLAACAGQEDAPDGEIPLAEDVGDLPLGEVPDDMKSDGNWGSALTCKTIPNLPPLRDPEITISIDGLSLRLRDRAGGYDKTFPVGVGAIDTKTTSSTFGESLSYWPLQNYNTNDYSLKPSTTTPCKIWWTDPETGERSPVFAGLPFMSWSGSYAIHGPIDNFRAVNGGNLRRGYVSHGCVRMEAADVLEVYALTKGIAKVPVRVQREPERLADGTKNDVANKWIGAECADDSECAYANGFCKQNAYSGRGVCSARCTRTCSDRAGYPTTFCVTDPDDATQGMCVPKVAAVNADCRPYDHFEVATKGRNGQPSVTAKVCVPGSRGWVGDRCFADGDCLTGNRCDGASGGEAGICTQTCTKYCPDQPGFADTFCADFGTEGECARTCTPNVNAPECPEGTECRPMARRGQATVSKNVCVAI
jgi:L,D-transpeptidase catalytic domain